MYSCNSSHCVRIKYNGQIMCECDYKSKAEYYKLLDDMKGDEYEPVIFDSDKDPCNRITKTTEENDITASSNNPTIYSDEMTDSTNKVTDIVQSDSLPLMDYKNGSFKMSENLPLSYYSKEDMITFLESFPAIKIKIESFDTHKPTIYLSGRIAENIIITSDSSMFSFDRKTGGVNFTQYGGERIQLIQKDIE